MVPRDEILELDMSIPDAMKVIISGGAVVPPWKGTGGEVKVEQTPTPTGEAPSD